MSKILKKVIAKSYDHAVLIKKEDAFIGILNKKEALIFRGIIEEKIDASEESIQSIKKIVEAIEGHEDSLDYKKNLKDAEADLYSYKQVLIKVYEHLEKMG